MKCKVITGMPYKDDIYLTVLEIFMSRFVLVQKSANVLLMKEKKSSNFHFKQRVDGIPSTSDSYPTRK